MSRIKVGDEVVVLSGKDKGKIGKVIERIFYLPKILFIFSLGTSW